MNDTIFYVGGGVGGVGKSIVSWVLVQFLIGKYGKNKAIHLIETNELYPDVGRVYRGKIPVSEFLLNSKEGDWFSMFDTIERSRDTMFVINTAPGNAAGIRKHGPAISAVLASWKIPYNFVTFWPINRQKNSVIQLEDFLECVTYGPVFPIRNKYFGEPKEFVFYKKHLEKTRKLCDRVTKTLDFPALYDCIADEFYIEEKTIPEIADSINAFEDQLFLSWRDQAYAMFESTGVFRD